MNAKEVVRRMKDFGLKGVRDGSAHFFIKPGLLAEFVQSEILAERPTWDKPHQHFVQSAKGSLNSNQYVRNE